MTDIASLGMRVDSSTAVTATANLDKLTASAVKAETAAGALASASTASAQGVKTAGDAVQNLAAKQATANQTINNATISAGQYKQALRQLPAQFTDIVTGLQAGQTPFTVFIQQGGQIKDSFGGAGNALKAVASFITPLRAAVVIATAAFAGLFAIFRTGQQQAFELEKAITTSGNAAGTTAGQLSAMADSLAKIGVSRGQAIEALTKAVSTNLIPSDLLQPVSKLALQLQQVTGKAVEDTIKEFAALGDKPVDAADALQKKYNFLTVAVYQQIQALQAEGRTADAAALAQNTFLDSNQKKVDSLKSNLGSLQKFWNEIVATAKFASDQITSVGRTETPQQELLRLQATVTQGVLGRGGQGPGQSGRTFPAQQRILELQKQIQLQEQSAKNDADAAQQIKNYSAALITANASIQAALDLGRQSGANVQQALQNATQVTLTQIQIQDDALEASRNANLISDKEYYDAKAALIQQSGRVQDVELAKEAANIRQQIDQNTKASAALRALATTPEQIQQVSVQARSQEIALEGQLADIEARRKLTAIDTGRQVQQTTVAEANAVAVLSRAYADLGVNSQRYIESLQRQNDLSLSGVGAGQQSRGRAADLAQIQDSFRQQQERLQDDLRNQRIQQPQFDLSSQILKDGLAKAEAAYDDYYANLDKKQSNWVNGAQEAFHNYVDAASNVANLADQAFSSAFKSMEDAIAGFLKTGKLSFADLATSILADLFRIEAQILASQALKAIFGAFGYASFGSVPAGGAINASELGGGFAFAAAGGDISGPTIVGEKGPELIIPKQASTVIPNNMLRGMGGGGTTVYAPTTIDARGASIDLIQALPAILKRSNDALEAKIVKNIQRNKYAG